MSGRRGPSGEIVSRVEDVRCETVVVDGRVVDGVCVKWLLRDGEYPFFAFRVFSVEPGAVIPMHRHPWAHAVLVLRGKGVVRIGKARYVVEPGSFIFIPPCVEHEFVNLFDSIFEFVCVIPGREHRVGNECK